MNAPRRTAATGRLSGEVHSGLVTDPVSRMGAENVTHANANSAPAVTSLLPLEGGRAARARHPRRVPGDERATRSGETSGMIRGRK
jgi:hypothetical protein